MLLERLPLGALVRAVRPGSPLLHRLIVARLRRGAVTGVRRHARPPVERRFDGQAASGAGISAPALERR
jgi:hypothetical protein